MVPQLFVDSPQFEEFVAKVVAEGGTWERVMGGMLFVHLPKSSLFDPEVELG